MARERHNYDRPQRALHWLMAALILIAFPLGIWAHGLEPKTPLRGEILFFHKSFGMFALALFPLRALWRLAKGAPAYRVPLDPHVRMASHAAHGLLYALMIALPISGYVMSAAGNRALPFFGLFQWPRIVPVDVALSAAGNNAHYWLSWATGAVVGLHLLAVIWHRWIRHDEVMARMLPDRRDAG